MKDKFLEKKYARRQDCRVIKRSLGKEAVSVSRGVLLVDSDKFGKMYKTDIIELFKRYSSSKNKL